MKDIRQRDQYREQMNFKREQATVQNADSKTKLSLEKEKLATQRDIASKNLQIARENKNKYDVKDTKEKKKMLLDLLFMKDLKKTLKKI